MNNSCPKVITSRRRIVYRKSQWRVHQFKILSGDTVCNVAVLRMEGSLLLWFGGGKEPELNEIALGMPPGDKIDGSGRSGLATTLHGTEGTATALARRLTGLLRRPVYVCSGSEFDRFTLPLVERGLMNEIKNRPECF